jgi:anaerobic C4-dicarboxylate transporter DcuB
MWLFLGGIAVVALLGAFESLRPAFNGKPVSMIHTIPTRCSRPTCRS